MRLVAFQPATRSRVLHRGALDDICHSQPSTRLQRPDVDLLGPRFQPCRYRGTCDGVELRDVAASPELWLHSATLACEPGCDRPRGVPHLPGLTSPSTFPSHRFSRPQGFTSRKLWWPYLMPPPHIGFSPTELFPRKIALEWFPIQCLLDVTCWHINPRDGQSAPRSVVLSDVRPPWSELRFGHPGRRRCVNTLASWGYSTLPSGSGIVVKRWTRGSRRCVHEVLHP